MSEEIKTIDITPDFENLHKQFRPDLIYYGERLVKDVNDEPTMRLVRGILVSLNILLQNGLIAERISDIRSIVDKLCDDAVAKHNNMQRHAQWIDLDAAKDAGRYVVVAKDQELDLSNGLYEGTHKQFRNEKQAMWAALEWEQLGKPCDLLDCQTGQWISTENVVGKLGEPIEAPDYR